MELLIRIVDKTLSGNAEIDAQRTRAGDVIVVMPDGHIWGTEEILNPDWRIVRVPGLSQAEALSLVSPETATAFGDTRRLRKRQMSVDLEQLDIMEGGTILSSRTATPRNVDAVVSHANFRSCYGLKPRQDAVVPLSQRIR